MTREYLVALPDPDTALGGLRDELAVRIGRIAISSEAVQDYIGHLYVELAGPDVEARAKAFERLRAMRSDSRRRELTIDAAKTALSAHPALYQRLVKFIEWAKDLTAIIHQPGAMPC